MKLLIVTLLMEMVLVAPAFGARNLKGNRIRVCTITNIAGDILKVEANFKIGSTLGGDRRRSRHHYKVKGDLSAPELADLEVAMDAVVLVIRGAGKGNF